MGETDHGADLHAARGEVLLCEGDVVGFYAGWAAGVSGRELGGKGRWGEGGGGMKLRTGGYVVFLAEFEAGDHVVVGHGWVEEAVVYHLR